MKVALSYAASYPGSGNYQFLLRLPQEDLA